jgi:hypothetical protein
MPPAACPLPPKQQQQQQQQQQQHPQMQAMTLQLPSSTLQQ